MQVVVTLSAVLVLVTGQLPPQVAKDFAKFLAPYESECICSSNVDPVLVKKWIFESYFPEDPCFRCFLKCIFYSLNVFNPDGTFNQQVNEAFNRQVPGRSQEKANRCRNATIDVIDLCERNARYSYCMHY